VKTDPQVTEKAVQVHAEYGVPYADTLAAVRQELEAEGCNHVEVGTDQGGHIVLIAQLPAAGTPSPQHLGENR
jgi:hypothetical protein